MVRLLLSALGMAFVAIVSLPCISVGEHAMHGVRWTTAPWGQEKNVSGPVRLTRAPQAPEVSTRNQAPPVSGTDSFTARAAQGGRGPVRASQDANQWMPQRPAGAGMIRPPDAPEVPAEQSVPNELWAVLARSFPERSKSRFAPERLRGRLSATPETPPAEPRNLEGPATPDDGLNSVNALPAKPESKYRYLEIEVSHSEHVFKLLGVSDSGQKDVLYECRVGLGAREFPTPVGVYFVTHIYDKDPLWIPPPDRPWAWGQSASNRVYGGTMAPLLKKRPLTSKRQTPSAEDYIAEEVRLDDYGYRFHGTNAPRSIGHNESHGCVRMLPKDAREVANLIKEYVGAPETRESENGSFVVLRAPVRLNLIK